MAHNFFPDIEMIMKKRKELGITQETLSKSSGVPQSVISRIEEGKIENPSYGTVRKIFETLARNEALESNDNAKRNSLHKLVASDLMNEDVVAITPSARVSDAWEIMKTKGFSQLPVIDDDGKIVGGISEAIMASGNIMDLGAIENILRRRIGEVMSDPFPMVGKNTRLPTLVSLLGNEPSILVIENARVIGIITRSDLLEKAYNRNPG